MSLTKLYFANLTKVPEQKDSPLWLAHSRGALWCPTSLSCSLPNRSRISHHQSVPENSTCSRNVDNVLGSEMRENLKESISDERERVTQFFSPQKGHQGAWLGASLDSFSVWSPSQKIAWQSPPQNLFLPSSLEDLCPFSLL